MSSGRRGRRRREPTCPPVGRALRLTALSALLPGSGHLASGRRVVGAVILACFVALLICGGLLLATTPRSRILEFLLSPDELQVFMVAGTVAALVWIFVVYRSWVLTRPRYLSLAQKSLGLGVVVVLCLGIATPFAVGVRTAYEQRDVLGIFPSGEPTPPPAGPTVAPEAGPTPSPSPSATQTPSPTPAPATDFGPSKGLLDGKERLNVLLLGGDGGHNREGVRTDSMIMASIDTKSGRTVLVSLPRNLQRVRFVPGTPMAQRFPNGFTDLMNSVYTYAEDNPGVMPGATHPGAELIRQTFSYAIGEDIDYYVLVNMAGFRRFVNAIGGVTMDVPRRIPIGGSTDANGRTVLTPTGYLEPGERKLDGEELLWYGRSRYGSDDYDRMERQRCVLGAIAKQADPFELLTHFKRFASVAKEIVLTDIPVDALPELLALGAKGATAKVSAVTFVRSASFSPSSPDFDHVRRTVDAAIAEASSDAAPATAKAGVPLTRVCG